MGVICRTRQKVFFVSLCSLLSLVAGSNHVPMNTIGLTLLALNLEPVVVVRKQKVSRLDTNGEMPLASLLRRAAYAVLHKVFVQNTHLFPQRVQSRKSVPTVERSGIGIPLPSDMIGRKRLVPRLKPAPGAELQKENPSTVSSVITGKLPLIQLARAKERRLRLADCAVRLLRKSFLS